MGLVQFGELVDSGAEFVLDVADAVVGLTVSSGSGPIRGLLTMGFCIQECGIAWFDVSDLNCENHGFLTNSRCTRGSSHDCDSYVVCM